MAGLSFKRGRDFVVKELTQAAQQLAFAESEGQPVISLPRARLPCRLLTRHHRRQVKILNHLPVDRLVEGEQTGLMGQELAHVIACLPFCERVAYRLEGATNLSLYGV